MGKPRSLVEYAQESGRAGCDGKKAVKAQKAHEPGIRRRICFRQLLREFRVCAGRSPDEQHEQGQGDEAEGKLRRYA